MLNSFPPLTEVAGSNLEVYEAWYDHVDGANSGSIGAVAAAAFLKKSSLPDTVLGQIWDIADAKCTGVLDKAGLFVALKLVALAQNGQPLDTASLTLTAPPPNMGTPPPMRAPLVASSSTVWAMTAVEHQRYAKVFSSLGPQADKVPGAKVREVLMNSKLPMETLGQIWDLSDLDKDGQLNGREFNIAMHLVYRVLQKHPVPATLPAELLSSAVTPLSSTATPPPVPPPPQTAALAASSDSAAAFKAVPAVQRWVVTATDKARYDVMFRAADLDRDGFVSGAEIKDLFLQSGLQQLVLAHIWSLCDIRQTGKLNTEQFALAMYLLERRLAGTELPARLSDDMVPPTLRPKPGTPAAANSSPAGSGSPQLQAPPQEPAYDDPELQSIYQEVQTLMQSQAQLQTEISQKEAQLQGRNSEATTLQSELDTLSATLKQLEGQKGAANNKLEDLATQVEKLRVQVSDQESSVSSEERKLMTRRNQLNQLRDEEQLLDKQLSALGRRELRLSKVYEDLAMQLSEAKSKTTILEQCDKQLHSSLTLCATIIDQNDTSLATESMFNIDDSPFTDPAFLDIQSHLSPEVVTPTTPPSAAVSPVKAQPPPRPTSPFSQLAAGAGGFVATADPFAAWDQPALSVTAPSSASAAEPDADSLADDPFAALRPPSRVTPEPQSKKAPPPRPSPPKNPPARPPPPSLSQRPSPLSCGDSEGFANFANFDQFVSPSASSDKTLDPWSAFTTLSNPSPSDPTEKSPSVRSKSTTPSAWSVTNQLASSRSKSTTPSPWPVMNQSESSRSKSTTPSAWPVANKSADPRSKSTTSSPWPVANQSIVDPFSRLDPFDSGEPTGLLTVDSSDSGLDPFSSTDPFASTDPFPDIDRLALTDPFPDVDPFSESDPFSNSSDLFSEPSDPFTVKSANIQSLPSKDQFTSVFDAFENPSESGATSGFNGDAWPENTVSRSERGRSPSTGL